MVGCCSWEPVVRRKAPIRLRDWLGIQVNVASDYVTSSTHPGLRHILRWTSKLTRKFVKSSLGSEVHALSEMVDHMLLQEDFAGPSVGLDPGMAGLEDCKSPFANLVAQEVIAENTLRAIS